jgi:endonuclease/exonuclease/phosphatase family metal-dependent hydrolase
MVDGVWDGSGAVGRRVVSFVLVLMLAGATAPSAQPLAAGPRGGTELRVMTRNLYLGGRLGPVLSATTDAELRDRATDLYRHARGTRYRHRARAVAAEIAATRPALVGIQEGIVWRSGRLADPARARRVEVDTVAVLLEELDRVGLAYRVVARRSGLDLEMPAAGVGRDVRLTMSDVLLRDVRVPSSRLSIRSVRSGTFAATAYVDSPMLGRVGIFRQWIAADVSVAGRRLRVITTHLEAHSQRPHRWVRSQQVGELLRGPITRGTPTVVMGDLNSRVGGAVRETSHPDGAQRLVNRGFRDVGPAGRTCCQPASLRNHRPRLGVRIDLVLVRGAIGVRDRRRVGAAPLQRPRGSVRWASDHAGVVVTLRIPPP